MTPEEQIDAAPLTAEDGFCKKECPHIQPWEHPLLRHTAWCWGQMRELAFHDSFIADCLYREPDEQLIHLRGKINADYPRRIYRRSP